MTREQKMLAVVEAARVLVKVRERPPQEWRRDEKAVLDALAALDAHTEAQGETVEVAVNMWRNAASGEWCPVMVEDDDDDPERDRAWQHVGTLTARIPLPVAPTISATVTREGGE